MPSIQDEPFDDSSLEPDSWPANEPSLDDLPDEEDLLGSILTDEELDEMADRAFLAGSAPFSLPPSTESVAKGKALRDSFCGITDADSLAVELNKCLAEHLLRHPTAKDKPVTTRALNYYAFHKSSGRYRTFRIPKRTPGETRELKAPEPGLLRIQRLLLLCFSHVFAKADRAAHGFVTGRSVLTNAKTHVGQRFVLNLDLQNFFPRTHIGRVVKVLQLPPFRLARPAAYLVANLCCDDASLPQGAPTSPLLTNLVCQRLDRRLRSLATKFHCRYTRYADDLTFSSNRAVFKEAFHRELDSILQAEGYEQNLKKQRLRTSHERQEVTGVIVNDRTSVTRDYIRLVKAMLHNWQTKGREVAQANFLQGYGMSKGALRNGGNIPSLERVLAGKIAYIGMIRGKEDAVFLRLLQQFKLLSDKEYADLSEALSIMEQLAGIHGGNTT